MTVALLGRERELEQLAAHLGRRESRCLVLSGEVGSGKTSLLRAVGGAATLIGWTVASGLSVEPHTTEQSLAEQVHELVPTVAPAYARPLDRLRGDLELHTTAADASAPSFRSPLSMLADELRDRAPVLLMFDGFRPSIEFRDRFLRFVSTVRGEGGPVVIVVGARPTDAAPLIGVADEVIELGPLDRDAVRRYFEGIAGILDPELSEAEIDHYAEAAAKRPEIAGALTAVLDLARPRRNEW